MKLRPILQDKRGQAFIQVVIFLIIAVVILVFFGLWRFAFNQITTTITSVQTPTNSLNVSVAYAGEQTFGKVNIGVSALKLVGFCMIFGMMITIIITSFLVRSHPVFFAGYMLIAVVCVIFSFVLSNAYVGLMDNSILGATLREDTMGSALMSYLPLWTIVISCIGAILLFAGMYKPDYGGGGF